MNKRQRDNLVKFFYTLSTASFTGFVIATPYAYKLDGLDIEGKGGV